jgi:hypothetical protein
MKFKKSNGTEIDIELLQQIYVIDQQEVIADQVVGIHLEEYGSKVMVDRRGRRHEVCIDDIFISRDEAKIICLKKQIATLKDNINASQRKLNKKLDELKLLEK